MRFSRNHGVSAKGKVPQAARHLEWYTEQNLKKLFPTEARDTLNRVLTPLCLTVISWCAFISCFGLGSIFFAGDPIAALMSIVSRGLLLWFIISLVYTIAYRKSNVYLIDGFRLVIIRGVFKKYTASVPLMGGIQVYVRREPRDMLFGLYRVSILAPLTPSNKVTEFRGFSKKSAYAFHDFLMEQCNRQTFLSPDVLRVENEGGARLAPQKAA